ncbi:MAG: hypothetical protein HKL98_08055 [Burkholderiales bacterium]|nr:hypothetical protein [Burkholderiales bacterium]
MSAMNRYEDPEGAMKNRVIDDRDGNWFRHVMDAIEHAPDDRNAVSEVISKRIYGARPADPERMGGKFD